MKSSTAQVVDDACTSGMHLGTIYYADGNVGIMGCEHWNTA